jgi:hypothetical protein
MDMKELAIKNNDLLQGGRFGLLVFCSEYDVMLEKSSKVLKKIPDITNK